MGVLRFDSQAARLLAIGYEQRLLEVKAARQPRPRWAEKKYDKNQTNPSISSCIIFFG